MVAIGTQDIIVVIVNVAKTIIMVTRINPAPRCMSVQYHLTVKRLG
jgi:hypothetical protein